jgi:hypothetical protein
MERKMATAYEAARNAYVDDFKRLLDVPAETTPATAAYRSVAGLPQDILATRVETLADKSAALTQATAAYFDSEDNTIRQMAATSLLQQVDTDLMVAQTLCESLLTETDGTQATLRSSGGIELRMAARDLDDTLPASIEGGDTTRNGVKMRPQNADEAVIDLRQEIEKTLQVIEQRVLQASGVFAQDLLKIASKQWNVIVTGAQLIGKATGSGDVVQTVVQGVDSAFGGIARALGKILGTVIDKITVFLQGNAEARDKVLELLDQAKDASENQQTQLFQQLVNRLLNISIFTTVELPIWLEGAASGEVKRVHTTADMTAQLGQNYSLLADQAEKLSKYISFGSIIAAVPALTAIAFGLQVGLLTTVIFAAYDYMDAGDKGINITKGLREVLRVQLDIPAATLQRAALAAQTARQKTQNS